MCERCHEQGLVDVHHLSYRRLGEEPLTDLLGLCRDCHSAAHGLRQIKIVDGYLIAANGETIGRLVSMTLDMEMGDAPGGTYKEGGEIFSTSRGNEEDLNRDGGAGETTHGPSKSALDVKAVWDHYCQVFADVDGVDPSRMSLNATRSRVIRNALKVRSVDQCKLAIDGLARSPWHHGENDQGKKYLDIRYALKGNSARGESNEERIDKMAELASAAPVSREVNSSRLPEGVSREMILRRLEEVRAWRSSGRKWEPARADEAIRRLNEWGLVVTIEDAPPWATLKWKESSDG
jgi:hypothetical protein